MYQLFIAITVSLAGFVHSPVISGTGDHEGIETQRGSLMQRVSEVVENQLPEGSNRFVIPTSAEQKVWAKTVRYLLNDKNRKANRIIWRRFSTYKMIRFTDESVDREFILLEERSVRRGWGFYIFDPASKSRLVIEVPHPISDENTEREGIEAFLQTGAKAFLLAGTHRRANQKLSSCTQATPRSRYAESDVAHNTQTMFHRTHEVLLDQFPDTVAVQLHGMKSREICPNVFLSSGTKDVTTNSRKLLNCLVRQKVESGIYDGRTSTCPLIARTNVQGRYSNGKEGRSCSEYSETSPEPGRFIHIEQEPEIRETKRSRQLVINALKCAFQQ